MKRAVLLTLVSLSAGCGNVVQVEDGTGGASSDAIATSVVGTSGTGGGYDYGFDETFSELQCNQGEFDLSSDLWIEIYPGELNSSCLPPPDVSDEFSIIFIERWDGTARTYEVSGEGLAGVIHGLSMSNELSRGTVRVEVGAPWSPSAVFVDVTFESGVVDRYSAELTGCFVSKPQDPCD